jgi:hypothetical protein
MIPKVNIEMQTDFGGKKACQGRALKSAANLD